MALLNSKLKLPAYTNNDLWVFLSVVPLSIIICNSILLGEIYFQKLSVFLSATGIYLVWMFFVFLVCGIIALRFLEKYPDLKDTRKRIVLATLSIMAVTAISITPLMYLYDEIALFEYTRVGYTHAGVVVISLISNIIITIIFEGLAAFERWKATLYETEQLKKENLRSQLQSLKDQINPHFLFNSINSLSSLIAEDPEKAEEFLDEMSKVYRYLLRNNEDNLISLSMELQFINSYYHLLKTRYGEAINLIISVDSKCKETLVPPLTLQILLENAVKHNIISKEQPLEIKIICENNEKLIVKNNLQRKSVMVLSNQVGLENIAAKYKLLNQPEMVVMEENNEFVVIVHLIQPGKNASDNGENFK